MHLRVFNRVSAGVRFLGEHMSPPPQRNHCRGIRGGARRPRLTNQTQGAGVLTNGLICRRARVVYGRIGLIKQLLVLIRLKVTNKCNQYLHAMREAFCGFSGNFLRANLKSWCHFRFALLETRPDLASKRRRSAGSRCLSSDLTHPGKHGSVPVLPELSPRQPLGFIPPRIFSPVSLIPFRRNSHLTNGGDQVIAGPRLLRMSDELIMSSLSL